MTTMTTDRSTNRLAYRPRRKRASIPRGRHGQPADFCAFVEQIQPSGYFGNNDALAFLVRTLQSPPEFGVATVWISTGTGGDSLTDLVIELNEEEETPPALSAGDLIAAIQASLSLQIKELADVLNVKRPTIYSWINEEAEPHASNRERLQQVYQIAQAWNAQCDLPAERLIRAGDTDGVSVVDLLKAADINEDVIIARFDGLAQERMRLKAEADAKRPPMAKIAEHHGFELSSDSDQQNAIDVFTEKRFSPD